MLFCGLYLLVMVASCRVTGEGDCDAGGCRLELIPNPISSSLYPPTNNTQCVRPIIVYVLRGDRVTRNAL
jgi:hypothetical protein